MKKSAQKPIEKNIKNSLFSLAPDAKTNISVFQLAFRPIKLLFKNWQTLILLGVPFALLLTLCSMIAGRSALCNVDSGVILTDFHCSDTVESYYLDVLIRFLIISAFMLKWYSFALLKEPLTLKNLFTYSKDEIKTFGIITVFAIINLLPLVGMLILFARVPNPNWKIELVFFTCVAWVFLLPLMAIRFYSIIASTLEDNKNLTLKEIWNKTSGNTLKLLLGTGFIVFIALIIFMQYYSFILGTTDYTYKIALSVELEYDFLVVLFAACFMNYCYTQRELLLKGEDNASNN